VSAENLRHLGRCFVGRRRLGYANGAWRAGWFGLACDDLRPVGLKLIFLVVTRAVSVLGLSRREAWWKDAEILSAADGHGCPAGDAPVGRRCAALCGRWC
jgi:hypothetical protein